MSTTTEKRAELWRLKGLVAKLAAEIRNEEQAQALASVSRLPPHQALVMGALAPQYEPDEQWCFGYDWICRATNLNRLQARRAVLALRRLGLVDYQKGLWSDDGLPAGSGFAPTATGAKWWAEHAGPVQ